MQDRIQQQIAAGTQFQHEQDIAMLEKRTPAMISRHGPRVAVASDAFTTVVGLTAYEHESAYVAKCGYIMRGSLDHGMYIIDMPDLLERIYHIIRLADHAQIRHDAIRAACKLRAYIMSL